MRTRQPTSCRSFNVFLTIPILVLLGAVSLIITPLYQLLSLGLCLLAVLGVPLVYLFINHRRSLPDWLIGAMNLISDKLRKPSDFPTMSHSSLRPTSPDLPYVVMVGDVGIGKSTIVEKLTGFRKLSSAGSKSFTKTAMIFRSGTRRLDICDTPGSNPMQERYEHNFWIAQAMSHKPVSCLLIVVQARARISNVIDEIIKYAEAFEPKEFTDVLAACVTHMDTVTEWNEEEFRSHLAQQTGIEFVVFTQLNKSSMNLENDILSICNRRPVNIAIDSDNFLRFFKINDRNYKILRTVRKEVDRFESIKTKFYASNEIFMQPETIDLAKINPETRDMLFEFQAWMTDSIVEAQKRVAKENNFQFYGPEMANEAGHIANLTNQLKSVLLELRTRCLSFTSNHGINELRKCPHCGLVWAKIIGCTGNTTCGNLVNGLDVRFGNGVMATFTFVWDERSETLQIHRSGQREAKKGVTNGQKNKGCGKSITWSSMALVDVPEEFCTTHEVNVNDVESLSGAVGTTWKRKFETDKKKYKVLDVMENRGQSEYDMDQYGLDFNYASF